MSKHSNGHGSHPFQKSNSFGYQVSLPGHVVTNSCKEQLDPNQLHLASNGTKVNSKKKAELSIVDHTTTGIPSVDSKLCSQYQLLFLPNIQDGVSTGSMAESKTVGSKATYGGCNLLLQILSKVIERLIESNSYSKPLQESTVTKFHSSYQPDVTMYSYMERIRKYANCHDSCFLVALIYIDRLILSQQFILSPLNIHRLFITSIMLAVKFYEDDFYKNTFYAKLGGIPPWEMNCLEVELLRLLNFNLVVSTSCFDKYYDELKQHANSMSIPYPLSIPQHCYPSCPSPVEVTGLASPTNPHPASLYHSGRPSSSPSYDPYASHVLSQYAAKTSPWQQPYQYSPASYRNNYVATNTGTNQHMQNSNQSSKSWYPTFCNPSSVTYNQTAPNNRVVHPSLQNKTTLPEKSAPANGYPSVDTSVGCMPHNSWIPGQVLLRSNSGQNKAVNNPGIIRQCSTNPGYQDAFVLGMNYSPMVGSMNYSPMTTNLHNFSTSKIENVSKDPSPRGVDQYWIYGENANLRNSIPCNGGGYYLHRPTNYSNCSTPINNSVLQPSPIDPRRQSQPSMSHTPMQVSPNVSTQTINRSRSNSMNLYGHASQPIMAASQTIASNVSLTYGMLVNGIAGGIGVAMGTNHHNDAHGNHHGTQVAAAYHHHLNQMTPQVHTPSGSFMMFNL